MLAIAVLVVGIAWTGLLESEEVDDRRAELMEALGEKAARERLASAKSAPSGPVPGEQALPGGGSAQELRDPGLALRPPVPPAQRLSCSEKSVAQLRERAVHVFRVEPFARVTRLEVMGRPLAALSQGGHSHLIVTDAGLFRHYQAERRAHRFARVPILGIPRMWPDHREQDRFWLRYLPGDETFLVPLADREEGMTTGQPLLLPEFDGHLFVALQDGSLVYSANARLLRLMPWKRAQGPKQLPAEVDARVLSSLTASGDRQGFWAFRANGEGYLFEVPNSKPKAQIKSGVVPYSVSARRNALALVGVSNPPATREWRLRLWGRKPGHDFEEMPSVSLPADSPGYDAWFEGATADRQVCFLPNRSWVAVGGATRVELYDYEAREWVASSDPMRETRSTLSRSR